MDGSGGGYGGGGNRPAMRPSMVRNNNIYNNNIFNNFLMVYFTLYPLATSAGSIATENTCFILKILMLFQF